MVIDFTPEMLEAVKKAKSVEDLIDIAKGFGVNLTEEMAAKHFAALSQSGELADDELENVSGGGCGGGGKRYICGKCGASIYPRGGKPLVCTNCAEFNKQYFR